MIHEKTFLGLIPETPRPKDYISGVNSPIVWTDVMPSGDWTRYASKYERQNKPFETFNCTAFSLTNIVEMWLNFLIETNQLSQAHLDFLVNEGYVDDGGGINLSERARLAHDRHRRRRGAETDHSPFQPAVTWTSL